MRIKLLAAAAALALVSTAANAETVTININDGAHSQTDVVATAFTPKYGYAGGPIQSWAFGENSPSVGGWLDFYTDGVSLLNEASSSPAADFFQTTTPFYSVVGSTLSFINLPHNAGTDVYQLTDGGSLTVTAVPEPVTWAMLVFGFLGLGAIMRRRNAGGLVTA